jgi:hypothetical protein
MPPGTRSIARLIGICIVVSSLRAARSFVEARFVRAALEII